MLPVSRRSFLAVAWAARLAVWLERTSFGQLASVSARYAQHQAMVRTYAKAVQKMMFFCT
jgi:hypothetical protein